MLVRIACMVGSVLDYHRPCDCVLKCFMPYVRFCEQQLEWLLKSPVKYGFRAENSADKE